MVEPENQVFKNKMKLESMINKKNKTKIIKTQCPAQPRTKMSAINSALKIKCPFNYRNINKRSWLLQLYGSRIRCV